jgi:hypothetical protein
MDYRTSDTHEQVEPCDEEVQATIISSKDADVYVPSTVDPLETLIVPSDALLWPNHDFEFQTMPLSTDVNSKSYNIQYTI